MNKLRPFIITLVFIVLLISVNYFSIFKAIYLPTSESPTITFSDEYTHSESALRKRLFGRLTENELPPFVYPTLNGDVPTEISSPYQWEDHNSKFVFISDTCNPQTIDLIKTRTEPFGIKLLIGNQSDYLSSIKEKIICGVLTYPDT